MTTTPLRAKAPGRQLTTPAPGSGGTPARRAPGAGVASFSPGALWLAEQAGYPQPNWSCNPWARGPLADIPLGRALAVVRVPTAAAATAAELLRDWEVPPSPVLDAGHVWIFLVHPGMRDGRDIPGGALLTGAAQEILRCPEPGQAGVPPRTWAVPPDGSGVLLDPWTLADALRTS
ncbi:hypothetical protein ACODT5_02645 [Streptomyces sp. 5.8]|uniref:hypothetical protein n=1 Tax=Streptomyces sp. 5.8 TaxID=3406571 RepID=UPI003BB5EE2B